MKLRHVVASMLPAVFAGQGLPQSAAAEFPERPLRYIVPFPPGGSTDIVARIVADALTRELGEQVVIDNRGGAGGTLGTRIAAQAEADGYTLFACNIASMAVSPALYRDPGYDALKDFSRIGLVGSNPNALAVNPEVPARSLKEFIALANSRPGKLNYSSSGVGTSPQLSMEMFKLKAGLNIVHVAYKGGGPAIAALIGGEVQSMFATVPSLLGAVRAEQLRPLAVTSKQRAPELPDVPALAQSGMPDFEVISWQGLCTNAGVPPAVLTHLRGALSKALQQPNTRKVLVEQGIQITPLLGPEYAAFIRSEQKKYGDLVRQLRIPKR